MALIVLTDNTQQRVEEDPGICHRYLVRTGFVPPASSLTSVSFLYGGSSSLSFVFQFLISFNVSAVCLPQLENAPTESQALNMLLSFPRGKIYNDNQESEQWKKKFII